MLLITWGYSITAHQNVVRQTGSLLTSYPDVLMATVALGLLVMVGITSARAARRRVSHETWHFIHLYTYLAIALAFSHQFATGQSEASSSWIRTPATRPRGRCSALLSVARRWWNATSTQRRHSPWVPPLVTGSRVSTMCGHSRWNQTARPAPPSPKDEKVRPNSPKGVCRHSAYWRTPVSTSGARRYGQPTPGAGA
jgi:hypothetical protein